MLKTIYTELVKHLRQQVPELRFIDLDRGQLEYPAENYVLLFPAVLLRIDAITWGNIGEGLQEGDLSLQARVCFETWDDINSLTPDEFFERGVENMDITDKVVRALHGLAGSNFNPLQGASTAQEFRNDGLLVFSETFRALVRRDTMNRPWEFLTPASPIAPKTSVQLLPLLGAQG